MRTFSATCEIHAATSDADLKTVVTLRVGTDIVGVYEMAFPAKHRAGLDNTGIARIALEMASKEF